MAGVKGKAGRKPLPAAEKAIPVQTSLSPSLWRRWKADGRAINAILDEVLPR